MMSNENINDALKNLSEEERELALSILKQMAADGSSAIFDDLKYSDFEEIPVDIDTFLDDDRYLGRGIWAVDEYSGQRRCTLFPYWRETLHKIFPDNLTTACNTLILTGCLGYDTPIPLLNGKTEKIGDLAKIGKLDEYVYSYDVNTNSYVPGHLIKAFSTGIKPVYEITLDNGQKIKATSNHKFMTRDKHWKSIDTGLAVGDSMMPFNTKTGSIADRDGYEIIENPNKDGTTSDIFTHRMAMSWKIGDYSGVVHHKDYNKLNNDPRNLQLMTWQAHKMFHAKRGGQHWQIFNEKRRLGLISPESEQKIRDGALLGNKNRWADENEHKKMSILTTNRMNNGFAKEMANAVWNGPNADINRQKVINNIVTANTDPKRIEQYQISKAIKVGNLAIKDFGELTKDSYEQTKLKYNMRSGYPSFEAILNRISLQELTEQAAAYNHKIIKIEFIGNEEVFDLTVEKYHNFAIKDGIVAHNSIGLGKTLMAVLCMLYLLYRMLCLKDPYSYYGMMPSDKITFAMLNITLDAAQGVGWDKLQQLVQSSDWFMTHGELNASRTNPQWQPPKGIELIFGSNNRHVVGRALFSNFTDECVDENTIIMTDEGPYRAGDIINQEKIFLTYNNGKLEHSLPCKLQPTKITTEEYKISLEDGTILTCTANHKLLLKDGTYKLVKDLTINDELAEIQTKANSQKFILTETTDDTAQTYDSFINNIINIRGQWSEEVYNSEKGCEMHHIKPACLGGEGDYISNNRSTFKPHSHHPNCVYLYPEEHYIAHKLLYKEYPEIYGLYAAWFGTTKNGILSMEDYADLKQYNHNLPIELQNKIKANGNFRYRKNKTAEPKTARRHSSEEARYSHANFGEKNGMYGHGDKISGGNNGHSNIRYFYKDKVFESKDELISYLHNIGSPITQSAIRAVVHGTGTQRVYNMYKDIFDNLSWEYKE